MSRCLPMFSTSCRAFRPAAVWEAADADCESRDPRVLVHAWREPSSVQRPAVHDNQQHTVACNRPVGRVLSVNQSKRFIRKPQA